MDRRSLAFLAIAGLAGLPTWAAAGNGIAGITIQREPNLTSVAVKAIVSGDDDSSAVLRIFQKWSSSAAFDTGMVMVRRVGTNIHEGRILWMQPGRVAHYYLEGRDAGGDFTTPLQLAQCATIRKVSAQGPVFYVNQGLGNDVWDGTRPVFVGSGAGPKQTIRAALTALAGSPGAGRNGGVFVAPGEYHERLDLDFGTDGDARFLQGDGTNRDSTIVCGANVWAERGLMSPGQPLNWTLTQDSTYVTRFNSSNLGIGGNTGGATQLVVIGWGEYVHRKTSVKAVLDDSTWAGVGTSTNVGELSGWFWRNDSLYVKRRNGQSPAGQVLHLGYLDDLIKVQRRNWRIANLTLRFAGGATGNPSQPADADPPLFGRGITAGLGGTASGLVVDSCRFYGNNADAIYVVHDALGHRADSVTVAHCIVDGLTVGDMAYGAGKARAEENVGQIRLLARASNVYDTFVTGGFNGIQVGPGDPEAGPADSTWGSQVELAYNTITNVADDAIELDTSHNINTLVVGNLIRGAGHGISQVPTYTGPDWIFYNTIVNSRNGGVKMGSGSRGLAFYYHNTIASAVAGGWAIDGSPSGRVDNVHFRNNILVGRGVGTGSGYTVWGPGPSSTTSNDFNYDLIDSSSTLRLAKWNSTQYSFPTLQSSLGWERNGVRAGALFADSTLADWSLAANSPAIGRGLRITGVNTSLDGARYAGLPDIGARSALLRFLAAPPGAPGTARLTARAAPNPTRVGADLEFRLPLASEVTVKLFDAAGRTVAVPLAHERLPAGIHHVSLRPFALRPGLYLYQVTAGEGSVEGKLVVLR